MYVMSNHTSTGDLAVKLQSISLLGICGVVLLAGPAPPVHAVNINTPSLACHQGDFQSSASPVQDRIKYTNSGIVNLVDVPTHIVCDVPRSPSQTATTVSFFVDGDNYTGATTTCVLYSYDYSGGFVSSLGFSTTAAHYDEYVTFSREALGFYNYVTIMCVLPPSGISGLDGAKFRGVTALQP
jgi:hypothetical protein